jgi:hypothetical protein
MNRKRRLPQRPSEKRPWPPKEFKQSPDQDVPEDTCCVFDCRQQGKVKRSWGWMCEEHESLGPPLGYDREGNKIPLPKKPQAKPREPEVFCVFDYHISYGLTWPERLLTLLGSSFVISARIQVGTDKQTKLLGETSEVQPKGLLKAVADLVATVRRM